VLSLFDKFHFLQVEKTRHMMLFRDTLLTDQTGSMSGRSYEPVGSESKSVDDDEKPPERNEINIAASQHDCQRHNVTLLL